MGKIIRGESNYKGFKIFDDNNEIKTENYSKKTRWDRENPLTFKEEFYLYLFLITIFTIVYNSRIFSSGIIAMIATASVYLCLFSVCGVVFGKHVSWKQSRWHAAEHMTIRLLESNKPINIENLRKMPMKSKYCGSRNKNLTTPHEKILQEALKVIERYKRLTNIP